MDISSLPTSELTFTSKPSLTEGSNFRCPECSKGDLDQASSGDGRWNVEWYAVPCNVGSSALVYSVVVSSYYWFSLVVSNTRYDSKFSILLLDMQVETAFFLSQHVSSCKFEAQHSKSLQTVLKVSRATDWPVRC